MKADVIVECGQIATPKGSGQLSGDGMNSVSLTDDAAMAIAGGRFAACGKRKRIERDFTGRKIELGDRLVIPSFVDCHSHALFAGSREDELQKKLRGVPYMQILKEGGGILRTVASTRRASVRQLMSETRKRLDSMLRNGITCVEVKSGYGLNLEQELRMLRAIGRLGSERQLTVPTYLGAHAVPPESDRRTYVDNIIDRQLPAVIRSGLSSICDIFVEEGAFTTEDAVRIFAAASKLGFRLTAHVDEFSSTGASEILSRMGAASLSHLAHTSSDSFSVLAENGTIGIILPSTPLFSLSAEYPKASRMISEGMAVALGTDLSPNSWNESMMLSALLSVYRCGLTQEEALTAATLNAACAAGTGSECGSIEAGKRADFICLDIASFGRLFYSHSDSLISSVYSAGHEVYSRQ
ncbi:MAG: imidazolonepropionase [Thermoplasmata archaeon]|nr:imidazolonepropionase [Candidatus Sysuiplasma jiujiangense]